MTVAFTACFENPLSYSTVWLLHGWCHVKLLPSQHAQCPPYNHVMSLCAKQHMLGARMFGCNPPPALCARVHVCVCVVFMHLYMCLCACKINCCRHGTQQSFKALGESVEMTLSGGGGGVGEEGETAGTRKRIIFFLHTYTEIVNHVLLFFFLSLVITIIQLIILSLWPFKLEFSVLAFSSEQSMVLTLQTEHGQIFIPSSTCLGQICQIPKAQDTYIQTKKTQASNMQQLLCTRLKMHMLHIILQKKNKTDKRL